MKSKKIKLDPKEFFQKLSKKEKNICFFYSHNKNGFEKTIAFNPVGKLSIKSNDKNNFQKTIKTFISKNTKQEKKIIGYISYDAGYKIHNIKKTTKDDLNLPDAYFLAFKSWITFNKETATIHYKNKTFLEKIQEIKKRKLEKPKNYTSKNFKPELKKSDYNKAYKKIKHHIKEGDVYQINLTHRLKAKTKTPPRELFLKTLKTNDVNFLSYIEGENFEILSASPERFVKITGKKIETCPVKGTRPRGKTQKEDLKLKNELIENEKETAELNMITDLLRNDLGKIAKIGTVKIKGHRLTSKCPTVWHTYSRITAEIDKKHSSIEAIFSMLSGGSITGCPKKRAMEIIDKLEPTSRSIYTGIIGQINPNQDCDFNIAIRTIIKKGEDLYLQVGGGIVLDSENKLEYEETLHKAESFMKIL